MLVRFTPRQIQTLKFILPTCTLRAKDIHIFQEIGRALDNAVDEIPTSKVKTEDPKLYKQYSSPQNSPRGLVNEVSVGYKSPQVSVDEPSIVEKYASKPIYQAPQTQQVIPTPIPVMEETPQVNINSESIPQEDSGMVENDYIEGDDYNPISQEDVVTEEAYTQFLPPTPKAPVMGSPDKFDSAGFGGTIVSSE